MNNSEQASMESNAGLWGTGVKMQQRIPPQDLQKVEKFLNNVTKVKSYFNRIGEAYNAQVKRNGLDPKASDIYKNLIKHFESTLRAYEKHGLWPNFQIDKYKKAHNLYESLKLAEEQAPAAGKVLNSWLDRFPVIIKRAIDELSKDSDPKYLDELYRFLHDTLFSKTYGILTLLGELADILGVKEEEEPAVEAQPENAPSSKSVEDKAKHIAWFGDKGFSDIRSLILKAGKARTPTSADLLPKFNEEIRQKFLSIVGDDWSNRLKNALASFGIHTDGSFDNRAFERRYTQIEGIKIKSAEDTSTKGNDVGAEIKGTYESYKKGLEFYNKPEQENWKKALIGTYYDLVLGGKGNLYDTFKNFHAELIKMPKTKAPVATPKQEAPVTEPVVEAPKQEPTPAPTPEVTKQEAPAVSETKPVEPVAPQVETAPAPASTSAPVTEPVAPEKPARKPTKKLPVKTPKVKAPKEETPVEPAKEETPAAPAKEEAPVEAPKEEIPAETVKEETPTEAPKEETPAEPVKEEAPAEPVKEESPVETPKEEAPKEEAPKNVSFEEAISTSKLSPQKKEQISSALELLDKVSKKPKKNNKDKTDISTSMSTINAIVSEENDPDLTDAWHVTRLPMAGIGVDIKGLLSKKKPVEEENKGTAREPKKSPAKGTKQDKSPAPKVETPEVKTPSSEEVPSPVDSGVVPPSLIKYTPTKSLSASFPSFVMKELSPSILAAFTKNEPTRRIGGLLRELHSSLNDPNSDIDEEAGPAIDSILTTAYDKDLTPDEKEDRILDSMEIHKLIPFEKLLEWKAQRPQPVAKTASYNNPSVRRVVAAYASRKASEKYYLRLGIPEKGVLGKGTYPERLIMDNSVNTIKLEVGKMVANLMKGGKTISLNGIDFDNIGKLVNYVMESHLYKVEKVPENNPYSIGGMSDKAIDMKLNKPTKPEDTQLGFGF